jgi:hypothetical protein
VPGLVVAGLALPGLSRRLVASLRRKIDAGAARLGQADGNRLLGGSRAVLSLSDVLDFLSHKFSGLRARRLAFTAGPLCFPYC